MNGIVGGGDDPYAEPKLIHAQLIRMKSSDSAKMGTTSN